MKDQQSLDALRHSAAHLLAAAVLELYPDTKPTIGPPIEDGFYYDFEFKEPISEQDLGKIEQKMRELVKKWESFEKIPVDAEKARNQFNGNEYKLEIIRELEEKKEEITLYKSGEFIDLCRGGHIENPKEELRHFKLMSLAGAYWRGNEKNNMLTRIYGTAFPTKEELEAFITQRDEAKKRDHKKLGKELDLFVFSELVGPGLPLWTPKGTLVRNLLDEYVWQLRREKGYSRVEIPHITKKELYETSGHWAKFSDELFKITTREGHEFAMKPMNCPHHTQIYARKKWSFRELPQRYANTTTCYRDEQTGELSGLSRVRAFSQDDAHVFARFSQVKDEFLKIWDIVQTFYSTFGFNLKIRLSLHDPKEPEKYLGDENKWQEAENMLREIIKEHHAEAEEAEGEAAFYGPKLDFMAKDSLGREWQVATIQLDMNMPERFDLTCVNEKGEEERIVMIHAAIMGSIERFLSILIEHYAGAFPFWLAPVQVEIIPIADRHNEFAEKVRNELTEKAIRSELNDKSESMQKKIRTAQKAKIPYMLVIGDKEVEAGEVNVRSRDGNTETMKLEDFTKAAVKQISDKQ
ncbi:threonine--tRNA ligase [Candidatus Roizmanbacteria bacterium]|nr:MAG: threonine--tRNA ligase [Candidatus Roizmanbacteria bacterium]